jgi:hypothetical protein
VFVINSMIWGMWDYVELWDEEVEHILVKCIQPFDWLSTKVRVENELYWEVGSAQ